MWTIDCRRDRTVPALRTMGNLVKEQLLVPVEREHKIASSHLLWPFSHRRSLRVLYNLPRQLKILGVVAWEFHDACHSRTRDTGYSLIRVCSGSAPIRRHRPDTWSSVTGLDLSSLALISGSSSFAPSLAFCVVLSPGSCFCTGSAWSRHLMGSDKEQVDQSSCAWLLR